MLVTAAAISATYYQLMKQEKLQASQQRIQVAFRVIFDDLGRLSQNYTEDVQTFLQQDESIALAAALPLRRSMQSYIGTSLASLALFARLDELALFNPEGRQLAVYKKAVAIQPEPMLSEEAIVFEGTIPEQTSTKIFRRGNQIGLRIIAPIWSGNVSGSDIKAVVIGQVFLKPETVERYATLTQTFVNFFSDRFLSLGTLSGQTELDASLLQTMPLCGDLLKKKQNISVYSLNIDGQTYTQGSCILEGAQHPIGAITASLPEDLIQEEIADMLHLIMIIAIVSVIGGAGLSALFSHKSVSDIQESVQIITAASEGDLRLTASAKTRDEIGTLAHSLNVMTAKLRELFQQVQQASQTIQGTADTISVQMKGLTRHMEEQTQSVGMTAGSIENITQFMNAVAENTSVLLSTSSQILASIQETRASIAEITQSTGALSTDLQHILVAIDNVDQNVRQISTHAGKLEETAESTTSEIQQIERFFQDVSTNAEQTQSLAKETMDAATRGERSVEVALQGITEMKDVVTDAAQIIQDISSWGEQVSSILGIVDDITEQTSLLALNASIISAQAGAHGKGFAVVADEIKSLATRTKSSTQEIGSLIHRLHQNTENGVGRVQNGLSKADQGMKMAKALKVDLEEILERATQSSARATDNAKVVQRTISSAQVIGEHMTSITGMVSVIRQTLEQGRAEFEHVVSAVENISGMAEQVSRANLEQKRAAEEIERSMGDVTLKFSDISEQTDALQRDARQIVDAVQLVESTAQEISRNAVEISEESVQNLVQQSELLQSLVKNFKT